MSDVATLNKRVVAGDDTAIPALAKLANGKDEDASEAAIEAIAASDSDLACETLCELAAGGKTSAARFAAMGAVDRKLTRHEARLFPMVVAACERHPSVDDDAAFAITFSDRIYRRKRATERELALVRRQLFASEGSVRQQAIAIVARVADKASVATLYRVVDELADPDDEDDSTIADVAEALVALGVGGPPLAKARRAATRSQGDAKRAAAHAELLRVLREARPR